MVEASATAPREAANSVCTVGSTTTTLVTYSNANATSGYVLKSVDLSAFVGKSVTIKFVSSEDSSKQTSFVLDDIALTAQ